MLKSSEQRPSTGHRFLHLFLTLQFLLLATDSINENNHNKQQERYLLVGLAWLDEILMKIVLENRFLSLFILFKPLTNPPHPHTHTFLSLICV